MLSSGFSYTLFYTYPIFNLLGRHLLNNEYIQPGNYLFITIAILGVYLIYNQSSRTDNTDNTGVIFAYIWGYILGGEKIYITNILGTLLIIGSIYMINKKN